MKVVVGGGSGVRTGGAAAALPRMSPAAIVRKASVANDLLHQLLLCSPACLTACLTACLPDCLADSPPACLTHCLPSRLPPGCPASGAQPENFPARCARGFTANRGAGRSGSLHCTVSPPPRSPPTAAPVSTHSVHFRPSAPPFLSVNGPLGPVVEPQPKPLAWWAAGCCRLGVVDMGHR